MLVTEIIKTQRLELRDATNKLLPLDLSFVSVGDILDLVRSTAGELAESVGLFDFYQGKQIAKGKKSVGVAIVYRAADRSLASTEVDKLQEKIVTELRGRFKAEIRDR